MTEGASTGRRIGRYPEDITTGRRRCSVRVAQTILGWWGAWESPAQVLFRLYQDVQERLIFRTETFLRDEVRNHRLIAAEVPARAPAQQGGEASG